MDGSVSDPPNSSPQLHVFFLGPGLEPFLESADNVAGLAEYFFKSIFRQLVPFCSANTPVFPFVETGRPCMQIDHFANGQFTD